MIRRHPDLAALAGLVLGLALLAAPGPSILRAVPVVAYLVAVPAIAIARHVPSAVPQSRIAIGLGGAFALMVLVSQAFLYGGDWSPLGVLAVIGLVSVVLLALPARRAGHAATGRAAQHQAGAHARPRHARR